MNYKLMEETIVVFYDEDTNFNNVLTRQKIGESLFKEVRRVHTLDEFSKIMDETEDVNQKFLFFVHLFHQDRRGFLSFRSSKIQRDYPCLAVHYISSSPREELDFAGQTIPVFSYDNYHNQVGHSFIPQTKAAICDMKFQVDPVGQAASQPDKYSSPYPQVDYAIITAMYKDEFEEIEKITTWEKDINTGTKIYKVGYLKEKPEKKIVAAVPSSTGMVDAAIIATQLLDFFRPRYLIMTGVCGGHKSIKLGDIVVAREVFTFQKGKLSDLRDEEGQLIKLYDSNGVEVDYEHLYDHLHNQVQVQVEKFEREISSALEIDTQLKDKLNPVLKDIEYKVNKDSQLGKKNIRIHFEPMACSTMVINKEGYFETNIKNVDRKTAAVEMESYGVARACKFANGGHTKFLIIKSVMDNTTLKNDKAKKLAAWSSTCTLKHLLVDDVL